MAELAAFTVLTFAAAWTAWLVSAPLAALPGFGLGGPVFLLGVFAPGIVALSLTAERGGRAAVGRLLATIGRWNVDGRLYLFAIFYMAGTKLIAAAVQRLATGTWPPFGDTPLPLMFGAIVVSMWVQAGERIAGIVSPTSPPRGSSSKDREPGGARRGGVGRATGAGTPVASGFHARGRRDRDVDGRRHRRLVRHAPGRADAAACGAAVDGTVGSRGVDPDRLGLSRHHA
jgi:hypothetical protein